jgi:hypothetical protein
MDQSNPPKRAGLIKLVYFAPFDIQCAFHDDPPSDRAPFPVLGRGIITSALVSSSTSPVDAARLIKFA